MHPQHVGSSRDAVGPLGVGEEVLADLFEQLAKYGAATRIAVVFGGIIPPDDVGKLEAIGVRRVFTPSDYELIDIMESIVDVIDARAANADAVATGI